MSLAALTLALTIPLGNPGAWVLDINPVLQIDTPSAHREWAGLALPGLILINPDSYAPPGWAVQHELTHQRQMAALGPWFWGVYAATLGRALEPYDPLNPAIRPGWAWLPPPGMTRACPLARLTQAGVQFEPCYHPGGSP